MKTKPVAPVKERPAPPGSAGEAHALDAQLRPGQSLELLKELHILTRDGKLNQDSRRKLKQVNHLYQFIEKILRELTTQPGQALTLADHGAGKSYLGFILYDLYFKAAGVGHIYGVETRSDLVQRARELAQRLGFARMSFLNQSVAEATATALRPPQIDEVTAH
ncbi:MAG: class I SAM-dependent methyltransferase, partial [Rhodoferax sp.]